MKNYILFDQNSYLMLLGAVALLAIMIGLQARMIREILMRVKMYFDAITTMNKHKLELLTKARTNEGSVMALHKKVNNLKEAGEGIFVAENKQMLELAEMMRKHDAQLLAAVTAVMVEVKKSNKDQQEIKTRLTASRKRELKLSKAVKKL